MNVALESKRPRFDEDMVELSLLLSNQQVSALERIAFAHDVTTGQLLRRVIHRFLQEATDMATTDAEWLDAGPDSFVAD
ncbi:MAG: hypothetical protein ACK4RK_09745 [Gemmataceae bacterium]